MTLAGILRTAATLGLLGLCTPILAETCYQVLDRKDSVIYRDRTPPWDLTTGEAGSRLTPTPAGERLMFFDADLCAPVALGKYARLSNEPAGNFFTSVREMGVGNRSSGVGVKSDRTEAAGVGPPASSKPKSKAKAQQQAGAPPATD